MGEAVHTLSIIIPAYNEEKTIAELLQRVLDADLGTGIERELIVVNDCSTDSTEQIVEDFIAHHADAPIVYLKHERNYGKGMAVRTGIRAVTGDYIVMQDADSNSIRTISRKCFLSFYRVNTMWYMAPDF